MPAQVDVLVAQMPKDVAQSWGWFLVLGLALVLLGILAIFRAMRATVISMYFFGWLFLFAAVITAVHAVLVGRWGGFVVLLLGAILFAVIGLMLLRYPMASAETLTLLMALYFIAVGVFHIVATVSIHLPGWYLLDGIFTLALGILVLAGWPASGLWVIGLFIGIDLIMRGLAWTVLALDARRL